MSSVGQAVGGIVGGVIGFFVGGPAGALKGAQLGIMAGGIIDPPPGPVINGPRLDDLSVQTSTYGAFIPRNYGTIAQNGNVFWIKGDALTETAVSTESGGKGGPTTTNNTWEYSATFAVGLCEGPIDGVRRIWIGNQLWYDAGSNDLSTIIASNENTDLFTLYLGTDTQNPDPLIQADKGVSDTPAYRGLAYIVFDNLPLADYSNSLVGAQVKVEIVKSGSLGYVLQEYSSVSTGRVPINMAAYGDHIFVVNNTASTIEAFNVGDPLNPRLVGSVAALTNPAGIAIRNGYAYVTGGANLFRVFDVRIPNSMVFVSSVAASSYSNNIEISGLLAFVTSQNTNQLRVYNIANPGAPVLIKAITTGDQPLALAISGDYVYVTTDVGNKLEVYSIDTLGLVGSVSVNAGTHDIKIDGDYAYITSSSADTLQIVDISDPLTPAVVSSVSRPFGAIAVAVDGDYAYVVNRTNFQLHVYNVSVKTAPVFVGLLLIASDPRNCIFSGGFLYIIGDSDTLKAYLFADNQITSGSTTLGAIVEAECLTSNLLTSGDLDVTGLTDSVRGYRIASIGAIRGGIDPLRAAWPFDVVQHGYQIKFKRRGSASVATINASELDAREAGSSPGVQITNSRDMDTLLPRLLTLKYIDADREYDINEQPAQRGQ